MNIAFSNRIKNIKPSPADGILSQMGDPELIPFSGGNPAPNAFPADAIRAASEKLLREDAIAMLQYSVTEGCPQLLQAVRAFLEKSMAIDWDENELLITSGSQQAVELIARVLCNEGDLALTEEYSFFVAQNALRGNGARLRGVPLLNDGVDLDALESLLKEGPKLFYVIPNFNNPTGITTSGEKRRAIYELAKKYGTLIIEDDPYGSLRFTGEVQPAIKSFDSENIVAFVHSFSKIMSPAMRISCTAVRRDIAAQMKKAKIVSDVHTAVWGQRVCAELLSGSDMDAHIQRISEIYGSRSRLMLDSVAESFHPDVRWTKPQGGMFMWVSLPERADMMEFCQAALKEKVALVPGVAFSAEEGAYCNSFRMCYSTAATDDIVRGCEILGKLTRQFCN